MNGVITHINSLLEYIHGVLSGLTPVNGVVFSILATGLTAQQDRKKMMAAAQVTLKRMETKSHETWEVGSQF